MRTLVVSDLHLGSRHHPDLLRRPDLREPLLRAVRDVDRLVLLGDVLELRHGPAHEAFTAARPVLEDLGAALPGGAEVVVLAGNHDHHLVEPWLGRRALGGVPEPLGLEQRWTPEPGEPAAELLSWLGPRVRAELAYPGVWLRDDVWAHHGHYLDAFLVLPTFERLAAGVAARMTGNGTRPASVEDLEAILRPFYGFSYAAAQGAPPERAVRSTGISGRAWRALVPADGRVTLRTRALRAGVHATVAALNAAGIGPLSPDLSPEALRRGTLAAMGDVLVALGVEAPYVVFGHTHRAGPWPGDDPAEWTAPTGSRLVNTGCWVHDMATLTPVPNASPYWPGVVVRVDDDGPPRPERLLGYRTHADLLEAPAG